MKRKTRKVKYITYHALRKIKDEQLLCQIDVEQNERCI